MKTVTIQSIITTLELALKNERAWARTCAKDASVRLAAERFAKVVDAVKAADWSAYKADLLAWVKSMERGASQGYSSDYVRNCESMKRYNEFRRILGLRMRKA